MKKILILLMIFILSCKSDKTNPNLKDIQEMYNIKGSVKEIKRVIWSKTTMEDLNFSVVTIFDSEGNPIEIIDYDKEGNIKNREPIIKMTEEEIKNSERKKVKNYDNKKRLIREYNNGFEILYKYKNDKISEEIRNFGDKTIQTIFDSNGLMKERMNFTSSDFDSYWQSKERFIYNQKNQLIETLLYRYSDEGYLAGKNLYQYDKIGSLIKETSYLDNELIGIETRIIKYN